MKEIKSGRIVFYVLAAIAVLAFLLWWKFPVYRISFQDISKPQELQFLKSVSQTINLTENWNPRFAGEKQVEVLHQRIRSGKEKTLTDLLRTVTDETSPEAKAGLEFQNCLIHELSRNPRFIKLEKLRAMPEAKSLAYIRKNVHKIVSEKRVHSLNKILSLDPTSSNTTTHSNPQAETLYTLFWKYHLPFFPEAHWFDLWDTQGQWRKSFQNAVKTDVLPVLDWYTKVERMRELNFHAKEGKADFLQLVMDGEPIRERFRVWANYSLYLCQADGNGLTRKINTGLRLAHVRICTESDNSVPQKNRWKVYSAQTGEEVFLLKTEPSYGTADVTHFLHAMGIPDILTIRLTKEKISHDFSKVHLEYVLELDELPDWKSKQFSLDFSPESCGLELIQTQIGNIVQEIRPEIWENLRRLKTFHAFPFEMMPSEEAFHTISKLVPQKDLPISLDLCLDQECRLHSFCRLTGEENEAICREIVKTNEKELKDFEPFLRVEKLQLEGNRLTGRCVVGEDAFESSEELVPKAIPFDFWILPDGTLETQVLSIQSQLAAMKKKELPPVQEEISPEELQNRVTEILTRNYPVLAPNFQVSAGKNGPNSQSLWFKISLQLVDYPNLIAGPRFVEKTDDLESEVAELVEYFPETAKNQWVDRYDHPRYGEIHSEITQWFPHSEQTVGKIQNQVFLNRGNVPFSWEEPLFAEPNGTLHEFQVEEIAEQMSPQFDEICNYTSETLQQLYETEFQLSREVEEDWIQLRPLKFSMMARCIKPFQLPFNFEVGKVRISAKEIEFPKRYSLNSDHTYWFPVMAVTKPKFDLDFERKSLKASASFTPPLPDMYHRMCEEVIQMQGENQEDLNLEVLELKRKELEQNGFPLEEGNSISLLENESEMLFGENVASADTDNPWTHWLRMDLAGSGDLSERAFGASGKLFLGNMDNVGLSGHIAPKHLELQANLDTRIRVKGANDSEDDDTTNEVTNDSGAEGAGIELPLVVNGGILLTERLKQLKVLGNFHGFIGDGMGRIYSDEKKRQSVGMNVGGLCPMLGLQRIGVEGDTTVNFERYSFDGSGTVVHPFMRVFGTLKYGVKIWHQSETDGGFKLYFEWVDVNGHHHSFEEEYPDASAVDEEEILRRMQEIEKEEKTDTQEASSSEIDQFQALGKNYPEAVRKGEQERTATAVNVELDQNGNIAQITFPDTNPQSANYLKSLMQSSSKKNADSDSNEDGSSEDDDSPIDIAGDVLVTEEGNQVVFTDEQTNTEFFRLNKQKMGLGEQSIKDFPSLILPRKNGTGCIVFIDLLAIKETQTPVFRRIKCSSPTTVQSKEEIRPGKYYGSEAESWQKIQSLFPGSVLRFSNNEEQNLSEFNALKTARRILCGEADYDISNVKRSESVCWYLEKPKKEGRAYWNIFKLQNRKPFLVFVPQTLCTDSSELVPLLPLMTKPRFGAGVPEYSQLLAKQMDPEKGITLLTLSVNVKVQEPELQVRQSEEIHFCPLRLSMNYWPEEKKNALWLWVLNQHLNGTIPIQDNGMVYAFGEEGVAVALAEPKAIALLPAKRVRQEGTSAPPVLVSRKQWEDWATDSERFLPSDLQSISTRQGIPFQNLVEILVMEWNSQNISPETWQCAPMGLLVGLGESTKEEKKTDH